MRFAPTTFRPLFGRVLAVVVGVIVVFGLAGLALSGEFAALARFAWPALLVGVGAFALFWFPSISVAEHEVTVRNVFSTVHVPWPAIQRVDTKWALTLYLSDGSSLPDRDGRPSGRRVSAWASPAPNRYAAQVGASKDAKLAAKDQGGAIRPGDLLETPSGAVAFVIRSHWDDLRESGRLDAGVEPGSVRREWHWPTIAVMGALAVATVLALVL
ncbi:MAG: PH domain-containing protein [Actinomycetota bacterium]|nr:PH domain-containing protein [Actinomycetota bacterium]